MKNTISAALCVCSNALPESRRAELDALEDVLLQMNISDRRSPFLTSANAPFSVDAQKKAAALNAFFKDDNVSEIFDVSGGDLANEVIPYLDYTAIAASRARFWGYSDLTCVINAIYAKTGKSSVLYQVRNILTDRQDEFHRAVCEGDNALFRPDVRLIRGDSMSGTLIGGNIRCFLKLAGTPYFPNAAGCVVLLESFGGSAARAVSYLAQLNMTGVFERANGVILGTFTELDKSLGRSSSIEFLSETIARINPGLPLAVTDEIGHSSDSRAAVIGENICI